MTIYEAPHQTVSPGESAVRSFFGHLLLLIRSNLITIARTPEALFPPIDISIFFLVVYQSTLGGPRALSLASAATTWASSCPCQSFRHPSPAQASLPRTWCATSNAVTLTSFC